VDRVLAQPDRPALRLVSSDPAKAASLAERYPQAETVVADYLDLPSLLSAFDGVDAAYLVTPDFFEFEKRAMCNVVAAAHDSGREPHLVRLTGMEPNINRLEELSTAMREMHGSNQQYQHARAVLNASGLPVTYLNSWAWFMSDFLTMFLPSVLKRRVLSVPFDRVTTFIDPREVGEAAAVLLMAPHDRNHDGFVRNLTGTERLRFSDVAAIMSDVLRVDITYEDDPDACRRDMLELMSGLFPDADNEYIFDYMVAFMANERREEPLFFVTDELEHLIGRRPRSLREWFEEHKNVFLAEGSPLSVG